MTDQAPYLMTEAMASELNGQLYAIKAQGEINDPRAAMRAVVALADQALCLLSEREPLDSFHLDPALVVPGWMHKARFSKRLATCLHREGYETPVQVLRDLAVKPAEYWVCLPNFGKTCLHELKEWEAMQPAPTLLATVVQDGEALQVDTGLSVEVLPEGSEVRETFRVHLANTYAEAVPGLLGASVEVVFMDEQQG